MIVELYKDYENKIKLFRLKDGSRKISVIEYGNTVSVDCDMSNHSLISYRCRLFEIKKLIDKYGKDEKLFSMYWLSGPYDCVTDEINKEKFIKYLSENVITNFDVKGRISNIFQNEIYFKDACCEALRLFEIENDIRLYLSDEDKDKKEKEIVSSINQMRIYDDSYLKSLDILEWLVTNVPEEQINIFANIEE